MEIDTNSLREQAASLARENNLPPRAAKILRSIADEIDALRDYNASLRAERDTLARALVRSSCYTEVCAGCGRWSHEVVHEGHASECPTALAQRIVEEINAVSRAASTPSATEPD